jgi:hypothetical protein
MTASTTAERDDQATDTTSAVTAPTAIDSGDRARRVTRRDAVLATALGGLVAAVVLFGLAFPQLLAPAVALAVLVVIIALDWLLPSGELQRVSARRWRH